MTAMAERNERVRAIDHDWPVIRLALRAAHKYNAAIASKLMKAK
jgi:hypothetical protein